MDENIPVDNDGNQKMVSVQFYTTSDMKKRLKMYCLSSVYRIAH